MAVLYVWVYNISATYKEKKKEMTFWKTVATVLAALVIPFLAWLILFCLIDVD